MGMLTEFKEFAMRGNVIDLAVGVVIGYGDFINTLIQFVIVAFAIFLVIKVINRLSRKKEAAPAAPAEEVVLLREIRDSLKK